MRLRRLLPLMAVLFCAACASQRTTLPPAVRVVPVDDGSEPPLARVEPLWSLSGLPTRNDDIAAVLERARLRVFMMQERTQAVRLMPEKRPTDRSEDEKKASREKEKEKQNDRALDTDDKTIAEAEQKARPYFDQPSSLLEIGGKTAKAAGRTVLCSAYAALVDCYRAVHRANVEDLAFLQSELRYVEGVTYGGGLNPAVVTVHGLMADAIAITRKSAETAGARSSQYGLYAGPNFSLGGDGHWKEGYEIMGRYSTDAFRKKPLYLWDLPEGWWYRGVTEISYQTVNALEEPLETVDGTTQNPLGTVTGADSQLDNPFLLPDAYLRMNIALQLHTSDSFGMQLGTGLSSVPNNDALTRLETRSFAGLHFESLFADGAYGGVFAGYAYDKFWEREVSQGVYESNYHRGTVDVMFIFPREVLGTRAVARIFFDTPLSGKGPSEVRASLLLYYSLTDWLGLFSPIQAVKSSVGDLTNSVKLPDL